MSKPFRGEIALDIRDSKPDWGPFEPPKARPGSPNVLYIVVDDTGIAAWDIFGGLIEMPNFRRIADSGLRFGNWHTTALCSPTRACLLTGRNAHMNNMACITEGAAGFPGHSAVIPPESGMVSEVLLENGYNTYCVGKWHLTPESESNMAGSKRNWPTGRGFERFYGFLGGETNQYYPDLVYDQHNIEQPYYPDQGYHLSKDLVDKSLQFIRDGKEIAPDKPWLMYLAFGANHAPHQAPKEWIDRYKGKFDMGYEKYREIVLANQKKLGIVPPNTELSPINPWPAPQVILEADAVLPWDTLSADQKRLFCRMAEVYAGFSSYTDHELGRLLDYLEESGQLDNTLVLVMSDNGASGEGSPNGSVNENKFFNGWPDDLKENLAMLDELGSPKTYGHYPTGWAWAFNAPYKMFKRYSLEGGIADPLVITWPKEMAKVAGTVRDQYHHAIDIVPTIYDCTGVIPPGELKGYTQLPIQGMSMRYTFADAKAATTRKSQYYEMLGTRAIYHQGWKAVARHGAISGKGHFMSDQWELYHTEVDRAETTDLASQEPERLRELIGMWVALAGRNNVFPLDDRTALEILLTPRPKPTEPRTSYVYYPNTTPVPETVAVNIRNRSFAIVADLTVNSPTAEGIIFAQGSGFGGHVLFLKGGRLTYVYNFLGINEQRVASTGPVPTGPLHVGIEFNKTKENPKGVANGRLKLFIGDKVVAEGDMRTQPGTFGLAGSGLSVGSAAGAPVTADYRPPFPLTGATVKSVTVNVTGEHYVDMDAQAAAMMARE